MLRTLALGAAALLAVSVPAQTPYPVGRRDVSAPNPTGSGSATLTARVHYPATAPGTNAPLLPRTGGWPVIVFLHGFATLGNVYGILGDALAAEGYIAVMSDSAPFTSATQELDGRALFPALVAVNQVSGGTWEGALDTTRMGLLGHSMGGGNVANVLANNPGYRCGFAFAPSDARGSNAGRVTVPFGIAVGTGDNITPWRFFAQPLYQGLTAYTGSKHLHVLDNDCNHTNVAGLGASSGTSAAVFQRSLATALGFFDRYLRDEPAGLEDVVGVSARTEPRLVSLYVEIELPEIWPAQPIFIGSTTRLSVAAEPGACGMLAALAFGSSATPFGELRLDAASTFAAFTGTASAERRLDATLRLPSDPTLIGARVPVQAVGAARGSLLRLGNATELVAR